MTIDQLRYVIEIYKCQSFSKASEKLYISQPSLSISIQKLEKELKEPLFIRSSSGVFPTPFCNVLIPYIQQIINAFEQMPLQIYSKQSHHVVRISIANGGFRFFSEATGKFYNKHKDNGVIIDFHDVSTEESLDMVVTGKVQLGGFSIWSYQKLLMERRLSRSHVKFVPLGKCCPTVSVGPKNPLYAQESNYVTVEDIREFPVIYSFSEHSNLLLKKIGIYNRGNLIICRERAARGELLSQTDGISIGGFPIDVYDKAERYPYQRILKLRGFPFINEFGYIYNTLYSLSSTTLEFIHFLTNLGP